MKLYYAAGVCSLSPHIALHEAKLAFEAIKVDYETKQLPGGGDCRRIQPLGYVPLLELDDGELLAEGPAIVQYIADLKPEAGLAPAAGTMARYRLQEWLGFINSELHKPYSTLFDKSLPAEVRAAVHARLEGRLDRVAQKLQGRPFLLGEQVAVGDAEPFAVLEWSRFVDIDLATWPVLQAFTDRVRQRPAVRAALRAEGLLQ
jgi:glutathione S-transferase